MDVLEPFAPLVRLANPQNWPASIPDAILAFGLIALIVGVTMLTDRR